MDCEAAVLGFRTRHGEASGHWYKVSLYERIPDEHVCSAACEKIRAGIVVNICA